MFYKRSWLLKIREKKEVDRKEDTKGGVFQNRRVNGCLLSTWRNFLMTKEVGNDAKMRQQKGSGHCYPNKHGRIGSRATGVQ